jgi:hypothetical protein
MIIVGAGMSGLIAAHYFRGRRPMVIEQQTDLPNNHEALLRFRSEAVSEVTKVPFRKMRVRKCIMYQGTYADRANPFLANMYSIKVAGKVLERSIWDMEDADRYLAPSNFINQAAAGLAINYGRTLTATGLIGTVPMISTIPMPVMMKLVNWPHQPEFRSQKIWSAQLEFAMPMVDVAQTIYYPDLGVPYYRASISGGTLIIEFLSDPADLADKLIASICDDFGIVSAGFKSAPVVKCHQYGKIIPIDDEMRKDFMYYLTRECNIYSLGRFATWRQILLDDVVNDCSVIEKMIGAEDKRSLYNHNLLRAKAS